MNWMTSGCHRALYSQRGRRRQMHFPSQVQRQCLKPTSPARSSQPVRARDSPTPWYIVPVGDDDESQDIRVLELERKGALSAAEVEAEEKAGETAHVGGRSCGDEGDARPSPRQKRSRGQLEQDGQDGRSERRCIFTPVKKARKFDLPSGAVRRGKSARGERPPSSIASGIDMLFFNDGEELPNRSQAQRTTRYPAEPVPSEAYSSRILMHISEGGGQAVLQDCQDGDLHSRSSKFEVQQQSSDGENCSLHAHQVFPDSGSETDQRDFQLWRVNSNSLADSSPESAFDRPESVSFRSARNPIRGSCHDTPPTSPCEASPLSFRMSRTEVLQSQLSTRVTHATHDQLETRLIFTATPRSSPSPSTSASSQGSIILGRPPLGWQKKLLRSLKEDASDKPKNRLNSIPASLNPSFPAVAACTKLENAQNLYHSLEVPLEPSPSPSSSRGSGDDNLSISTVVPVDAKERIMAATSQQFAEDSRSWSQRPTITKIGNANGADTVFSKKSMTLQSWVMSSRTKTILDAVSSSKALSMENAIEKHDAKYQEMESVAIYMCTLVQCYKIDENLRDKCSSQVETTQLPSEAFAPPTAAALTKQIASRREIIFSPKRVS